MNRNRLLLLLEAIMIISVPVLIVYAVTDAYLLISPIIKEGRPAIQGRSQRRPFRSLRNSLIHWWASTRTRLPNNRLMIAHERILLNGPIPWLDVESNQSLVDSAQAGKSFFLATSVVLDRLCNTDSEPGISNWGVTRVGRRQTGCSAVRKILGDGGIMSNYFNSSRITLHPTSLFPLYRGIERRRTAKFEPRPMT